MKTLDELPEILDTMVSKQKETKQKTYVARYKGKNLIMRSGKSSWRRINHVKAAVLNHFSIEEQEYVYHPDGYLSAKPTFSYEEREQRRKEFRKRLLDLIEIVELTE